MKNRNISTYIIDKQLKSDLTYILFISLPMTSPTKKLSPDKNALIAEQNLKLSPVKQFQQKLYTKDYFCHYSNAIYMGGMDCFKKLGHGIMLMDNGTCAITCHSHDNIINHNVFFADGCMISLIVGLTRARTVCFRTGPFMLYVRMSANNEVEGIGFFIHYRHRKLFRLKFQNEQISIKQRITDPSILKKVFDQNNLSQLIQQSHCKALKMQFQQQLPPYIRCAKNGNKYIIGIAEPQYRDISFLGLCFTIFVKDLVSEFDVFLEERGYIERGKMEKFGERHFQNGNYYIGEFKANRFQGRGVLVYPKENKWTLGNFKAGQIQQVIQSSVTNQNVTYPGAIKKIHQFSKSYIQSSIKIIPSSKWLYALVKEVDQKDPYEHQSIDYTKQQNQISENLNIVNEDYVNRKYENRTEQAIKRLTQKQKLKEKQSKSKGKKPSPTKIQNSYKNSPKKTSGTNDKNRRYLTRQADGTFRANSPPNKKPIPQIIGNGQIKEKDKNKERSRSRSNERQKSNDRNEGALKPPLNEDGINRIKTENYGQKKELDRVRPNISMQDEYNIGRAITGEYGRQFSPTRQPNNYNQPKQSPINRVGALMDNRSDPYNPMNKPMNLYPDHRLSPYKLYNPSPYVSPFSSPYPSYHNINPRRDYLPSPVSPLVPSRTNSYELYQQARVSPEPREHGRRRHFKYTDDDDEDEYNRLSNRPYARNGARNYEF